MYSCIFSTISNCLWSYLDLQSKYCQDGCLVRTDRLRRCTRHKRNCTLYDILYMVYRDVLYLIYCKRLIKRRLTLGSPGCLVVFLFDVKWPNTKENSCWLPPSDQLQSETLFQSRHDQEKGMKGPASLLQSWHWVLFLSILCITGTQSAFWKVKEFSHSSRNNFWTEGFAKCRISSKRQKSDLILGMTHTIGFA